MLPPPREMPLSHLLRLTGGEGSNEGGLNIIFSLVDSLVKYGPVGVALGSLPSPIFESYLPPSLVPSLLSSLLSDARRHNISIARPPPATPASKVSSALLVALPFAYLAAMYKMLTHLYSDPDNSKTSNVAAITPPSTRFSDVCGMNDTTSHLRDLLPLLYSGSQSSNPYAEIGTKLPSGVLLAGPPGSGKTLMARAFAGECGCPFISVSASDFVEMFR